MCINAVKSVCDVPTVCLLIANSHFIQCVGYPCAGSSSAQYILRGKSMFKNKTELLETWSKKQNLQSVYRVVCDLEGEIFYVCFTAVEFRLLNTQITPNI